jgi:hypothetical protein
MAALAGPATSTAAQGTPEPIEDTTTSPREVLIQYLNEVFDKGNLEAIPVYFDGSFAWLADV